MSKKDDAILFYEGEYYMFSNFSSFAVTYKGLIWMSSEHAYQAAKFEDEDVVDLIHKSLSVHDSKKVAQVYKSKIRKDWDDVKISIMEDIVRAKIANHPYIREKLLGTGEREIIEDSHQDSFWEGVLIIKVEMNLEKFGRKLDQNCKINSRCPKYISIAFHISIC